MSFVHCPWSLSPISLAPETSAERNSWFIYAVYQVMIRNCDFRFGAVLLDVPDSL